MPWVRFEPTFTAFKRAKTVHALYPSATVIGNNNNNNNNNCSHKPRYLSIVTAGARFLSSPRLPDRCWGPPTFLSDGYRGFFPGVKGARVLSWPLISISPPLIFLVGYLIQSIFRYPVPLRCIFNIILPLTPVPTEWPLLPTYCRRNARLLPPFVPVSWFEHRWYLVKRIQLVKLHIMQIFSYSCHFAPLGALFLKKSV
jgi:hypothetical protein